jgi:hypothetical protein
MPRGRPRKVIPTEPSEASYFVLGKQLPEDATLLGVPGDMGALIDSAKFITMVPKDRFDRLVRLYGLGKWTGKTKWECGKCGLNFSDERLRDSHGHKRHSDRVRPNFIDLSDCTEEQREQIKAEAGQPGLKRGDPGYAVHPGEFHTPDPSDRNEHAQDRQMLNTIEWEKTAASQRG